MGGQAARQPGRRGGLGRSAAYPTSLILKQSKVGSCDLISLSLEKERRNACTVIAKKKQEVKMLRAKVIDGCSTLYV